MTIKGNEEMLEEVKDVLLNQIITANFKTQDWSMIKGNVKKTLQTYFFKKCKRKPLIIPIIIETN